MSETAQRPFLDYLTVRGFKSIRDMDHLQLKALNVLIGANGSGKSNFIAVFRLLNEILEGRLQRFSAAAGLNNLLHFGPKTTQQISIDLFFDVYQYGLDLIPSDFGTLVFKSEQYRAQSPNPSDEPPVSLSFASGHNETTLQDNIKRGFSLAAIIIAALRSWRTYHFHDTSSTAAIKLTSDINDSQRLRADAGNLAAFLYMLQNNDYRLYYERIVETIHLIAPFFDDFVLQPQVGNPNLIRLRWKDKGSADALDVSALSDGTLRFMCLATLLLQPEALLPSIILIDEPELGLHPYAINVLAGLLKSASTQTQVIVSTQSVPLVDQFDPEDVIVVERTDDQSTFRRLKTEELADWLEEYGLGELWEKNVLGGRP